MFVSIHLSPQSRNPREDLEMLDEFVEQALAADGAGMAAICLTEHHLAGFNTYCDPFLVGSHLAGRLQQAYLALTVVQVPLQHPVRIVEQCNILDLLMRGRALFALAPGSIREIELDVFGITADQRSELTRQRVESMLKAWDWRDGQPPLDVSTDFERSVIDGRISPSSYRRPRPLLARASLTDATIADAARMGWPSLFGPRNGGRLPGTSDEDNRRHLKLYRETLAAANHDPDTVRECLSWLGFVYTVSLAETEQKAQHLHDSYIEAGGAGPIVEAANEGTPAWAAEWSARQITRAQMAIIGTPAMLVDRLLSERELGVEHARIVFVMEPGKREQNREMLQLFIEEVLPHLNPQSLPGPAATIADDEARPTLSAS